MAAKKYTFDVPSNTAMVLQDRTVSMPWAQLFTRWQWIVGAPKKWQDKLSERALGTPFINGTGRPITINVRGVSTAASSIGITFSDGLVLYGPVQGSVGFNATVQAEIPNGEEYTVQMSAGTGTLAQWLEYR